jgi:hypothetical protein
MSVDQSNASACAASAREALAEILASQSELQALMIGAFDRLDGVADGFSAGEAARPLTPWPTARDLTRRQVDRLAALAAELAALAAEQEQPQAKPEPR